MSGRVGTVSVLLSLACYQPQRPGLPCQSTSLHPISSVESCAAFVGAKGKVWFQVKLKLILDQNSLVEAVDGHWESVFFRLWNYWDGNQKWSFLGNVLFPGNIITVSFISLNCEISHTCQSAAWSWAVLHNSRQPHVATEQLKCSQSRLRRAVDVKRMPDFEGWKKKMCSNSRWVVSSILITCRNDDVDVRG